MTTVVNAGTVERDSIDDIRSFVSSTLSGFVNADAAKRMAKEDLNTATEKQTSVREFVLKALAERAHKADWSQSDVAEVVDEIVKNYKGNDDKKATSIATFKSEIVLSVHHKVRHRVADVFAITRKAFDAETQAAKDEKDSAVKKAKQPIKRAYSRPYHTAMAAFRAIVKTPNLRIETEEDVTNLASGFLKSRRFDVKRVKARLDAIKNELQAFYDDFPVDGINECVGFLNDVREPALERAYKDAQGIIDEPETEPEAEPENEPEVEDDTDNLYDARDAALRSLASAMAA